MFSEQISALSSVKSQTLSYEEDEDKFQELKGTETIQPSVPLTINNDYVIIVKKSQVNIALNTREEWDEFLAKLHPEYSPGLAELNSLLNLSMEESSIRSKYWEKVTASQKDICENHLSPSLNEVEMDENIKRMYLKSGININGEALNIIKTVLRRYGQLHKQIGYTKGLEYICYGILVTQPHPTISSVSQSFFYLMETLEIRRLYYDGSLLFYEQLKKLKEDIKERCPLIGQKLAKCEADEAKIFISYYKTTLLNRVRDKELIRRVYDLLIIYGIRMVTTVLQNILVIQEERIIARYEREEQFMEYMSKQIFIDYFTTMKEPTAAFKSLIIT